MSIASKKVVWARSDCDREYGSETKLLRDTLTSKRVARRNVPDFVMI